MISVCFRKGGHPAYDEIYNYPPEGVEYKEVALFRGAEGPRPSVIHRAKRLGLRIYRNFTGNINAIPLKCGGDLIYSSGGLMVKSNKPWVTDVEHAYSLVANLQHSPDIDKIKHKTVQHIKKSRCKILPWSYASLNTIKSFFGKRFEEIEDKFEVVYPGMHIENEKIERKGTEVVNFLYVNRVFWGKGGYEVLKAFDDVSRGYDTVLTFLSNTPEEIRRKFEDNNRITFIEAPVPRESVLELYRETDVFVLPTLFDTFGFVYLEAMAYGLPVIATNIFAVPEIVVDRENGLLVEPEYSLYDENLMHRFSSVRHLQHYAKNHPQTDMIKKLEQKMVYMIENEKERINMAKKNSATIEKGRFSITRRNEKLKEVYKVVLS